MVSGTTARGEPQQLGGNEAQRRQQCDGDRRSRGCGALSLPDLAAQRGVGGSPVCTALTREGLAALSWLRLPGATQPDPALPLEASGPLLGASASLHPSPTSPDQPPDLVLSDGHRVHRDGPPGGLRAPRGSLREQPCEVGLSTLQRPVKVCAANVHLRWGEHRRGDHSYQRTTVGVRGQLQ